MFSFVCPGQRTPPGPSGSGAAQSDDRAAAHSSPGYQSRFHSDTVKINRAFTAPIARDPYATPIARAVIGRPRALGVVTNAEGVETAMRAEVLLAEGCAEAQVCP
jgi:EAL domain-containing protein (putative c-di-GMP-specific phosphodiesterase class I)